MVITLSKLQDLRDLLDASHSSNSERLKKAISSLENAHARRIEILRRGSTALSAEDVSSTTLQGQALWVNSVDIEVKKIDNTIKTLQADLEKCRDIAKLSFSRLQGIEKTCFSMMMDAQKLNEKSEDDALEVLRSVDIQDSNLV